MWKIMCDRCGRMLKDGDTVYPIGIEKVKNGLLSGEGTTIRHLCPGCFCFLAAGFVREDGSRPGPAPEGGDGTVEEMTEDGETAEEMTEDADGEEDTEEEDPEEEEGSADDGADPKEDPQAPAAQTGGRRRVDTGKIMALYDAGWSARKIADEMGMEEKAVYNHVYYQKKRRML